MCKFDSPHAPGFRAVSTDLHAWALEAPSVIGPRWAVEDEERAARVRNDISERMSPYVIQRPLTPQPQRRVLDVRQGLLPANERAQREKNRWSRWSASTFEFEDAQ